MPTIPSPSRHAAALAMHNQAEETLGKGFLPGTIRIASGKDYAASIWQHDAQRPNLIPGAMDLQERIVFTIEKTILREAFAQGITVIWKEMGRAYNVERVENEDARHTSWQFEARRISGADPE